MGESKNIIRERSNTPLGDGGNHYHWGGNCDGWNLVEENSLSVKLERMPPKTSEQKHYHQHSQQFFYILKGEAIFEIQQERITVKSKQGIHISAGKEHRIINESNEDVEFILTSQPSTVNDRINIEE
ncbi:MAG TPA: cupin domain-containing protein [Puia sp.]|jgi:mannose-6-phosphate isomerase-like protein (cupin superfamily)|nr:cupin domain-containing protein [Puia sp.]